MRGVLLVACMVPIGCELPPSGSAPVDRVAVDASGPAPDLMPTSGMGLLRVSALDDETGQEQPARVIITAVPPTQPVRFDPSGYGVSCTKQDVHGQWVECPNPSTDVCIQGLCYTNGAHGVGVSPGVVGAPEGVLLYSGGGSFPIPAGTYDVFVTRGPEWEAETTRVTILDKANAAVVASLRHTVDTRGWMAADLHVHTGRSFDSQLQLDDRVVSEVAVGVKLIVTTDHNVLSDLSPDVEVLGYSRLARAIVGDEFNFYEGHGGSYPMPYDGMAPFGGAVMWGLDWDHMKLVHGGDAFPFLHAFPTRPAVTINHPRMGGTLGYFANLTQFGPNGWAPPAPLPDAGKFDGLEIMNGYMPARSDEQELVRDWFFLLNSGARVSAIGSSDTHRLRGNRAGFPRTWLRMPSDDITKILDSDLADAVKSQRTVASNGPFATLRVNGAQIGDLTPASGGQVTAEITVDAPAWIAVDKVRIFVNGKSVWETPVAPGLHPLFHAFIPIAVGPGDSWVALEVAGSKPLPAGLATEPDQPTLPFAITSPVFIDGDNDQRWTPKVAEPDVGLPPLADPVPGWQPPLFHPAPQDCEPSLWTDPSTWGAP